MDSKGSFLAEEVLKLILALVGIVFLVYILSAIYFNSQNSIKLEQAEATLDFLISEDSSLAAGEIREVSISNPSGWSVLSWPFQNEMPKQCQNFGWSGCLCVCDRPFIKTGRNYLDNCEDPDKGICKESDLVVSSSGNRGPIELNGKIIEVEIDKNSRGIRR